MCLDIENEECVTFRNVSKRNTFPRRASSKISPFGFFAEKAMIGAVDQALSPAAALIIFAVVDHLPSCLVACPCICGWMLCQSPDGYAGKARLRAALSTDSFTTGGKSLR